MTHARPHALNLAVAVAISSSIIGTQALAERRLQTKSIDIAGNGHTEFTQSEVMVQPTLGDDQQPIPKSFTTTYPDQAQATAGYNMPSEGFTDVLSGIAGGVSTVDLFETDDNDIAQKYTKVLKVGNEGVFRFTHNLAENNLLIEVRFRMTQQDSIGAVRAQLGDTQTLEPFTEIACPEHLIGVLKGASEKAGNLGEVDHYVALATLKVDKVKVNGRTFMRLIAAGVQPPELHRLGQSLFVNDEALFAAATSAYTQVHILGKDLQQRALNDLLSYHKPVGYVVHVEDETQSYSVPAGYPKLEVTEAPGDIIVFRGQKQNPADLAFVEGFYKLWEEDDVNNPKPPAATQVKKDKVKGYHYIIRSRQMALLEEIAAKHDAQYGIDKLITLMYYESLKQALASAAPDQADEFEFTIRHIRVASSVVTPTLMHHQLVKNFSFKPTLTNLLNNRFFVWDIENTVSVVSGINLAQANALGDDEKFASKILGDVLRQLIEMENEQSKPEGKEDRDTVLNNQLKRVIADDKEKHRTLQLALHRVIQLHLQQQADEVVQPPVQNQQKKEEQKNGSPKRHHEVKRTPVPKQPVRNSRPVATRVRNAPGAAKLPAIEGPSGITPAHENDLDARFKTVQPHLPHKKELTDTVIHNYLADIEILLGLVPDNKKDPKVRHQAIKQRLKQQATRINRLRNEIVLTKEKATASEKEKLRALQLKQKIKDELLQVRKEMEELQNQSQILQQKIEQIPKLLQQVRDTRADATKARNAQLAAELEINDWDDTQPTGEQARLIRQEIHKIKQLLPATEQLDEEAVKAKPATTGGKRSITLINENDMAALPFIPQPLQPNEELSDKEARERLVFFEGKLSLIPENKDDLEARHQHLQKCIKQQFSKVFRQDFQNQQDLAERRKWLHPVQDEIDRIPMQRKGAHEALATRQGAAALEIDNRDDTQPSEKQARLIIEKVYEIKQPETVTPLTSTPVALTSIAPTSIASTPVAAISIAATTLTTKDSSTEQLQFEAVKETLADHDALLEATEEAVVLKPDSTDTYDDRLDALRKKQVQPGGDDGTGGKIRQMIQELARLESEIKTGPQHYDNEIHGMGKAAIHYVDHEQRDLKSFSEYFAKHSANGDRIIALLREGLISKIELEQYMKAVRGADVYQTVDEFEHFLGYKHGVSVPEFKKVVQMMSDKGSEEFMQSAFTLVTVSTNGPAGMKDSVTGMKEYAAAVIANYVLDDIAFENGRKTAAFLANIQDTLTPYAHAAGIFETELIQAVYGTLMQAHAAAAERQLMKYWVKPSASLIQAVTWYFSNYKALLVTNTARQAASLSLSNMAFLYLLDLTNRGDYTHRMLTPFQHWLERYGVDLDRTGQYAFHSGIEKVSEVSGLAMPFGKAASSVILLKTGSMLFIRQYHANPRMYRSIFRLVPEMLTSMASGQGVQVPLLQRVTPEKVKTLASATAGLVLGPIATVGAYVYGLASGFTFAQTFGFALASSLSFDFFMNDNKMLTQWLGGPLGRSLDGLNRWRSMGERESDYLKRNAIATPQGFSETDQEYTNRVKADNVMYGWTRNENYLQFRERRDHTMKMYEHGWENYFRENVPKWSFSHAKSIPYSYTLGVFYEWQQKGNRRATRTAVPEEALQP